MYQKDSAVYLRYLVVSIQFIRYFDLLKAEGKISHFDATSCTLGAHKSRKAVHSRKSMVEWELAGTRASAFDKVCGKPMPIVRR